LVAVRRSSSEIATARPRHGRHRRFHASLNPCAFSLAQPSEEGHHEVVRLGVGIDPTADLRDPKLDAMVDEQRKGQRELCAGKGALRLADHDRVEPAVAADAVRQES
jgi:hypothetical protein